MSNGVNKIIFGFVGPIASGKGTVCQYLKENHQAAIYKFSTPLRDILARIYQEINRDNLQNLSSALRQSFGDDLLALTITNDIKNEKNNLIAIDGVRREPDIKYLKEIPGFYLIEINSEQKTRWERITKRGENSDDNQKTFAEFQADEQKEAERQIKEVAKLAKFKVDNNGTRDELYRQVEEILKNIG
ncbi:MAG TPA: AAA family ATPase [Patescibacteria group bacterium]|nr:AAA family ATPase [Patescibacteria group bacterium]